MRSVTIEEFPGVWLKIQKAIFVGTHDAIAEGTFVMAEELIDSTPVDTGQARSNWLPSLGAPADFTRPPYAPGNHLGRQEQANRMSALVFIKDIAKIRRAGEDMFITNNLHYIEDLNRGKSLQVDAGFVQRSVDLGALHIGGVLPEKIEKRLRQIV